MNKATTKCISLFYFCFWAFVCIRPYAYQVHLHMCVGMNWCRFYYFSEFCTSSLSFSRTVWCEHDTTKWFSVLFRCTFCTHHVPTCQIFKSKIFDVLNWETKCALSIGRAKRNEDDPNTRICSHTLDRRKWLDVVVALPIFSTFFLYSSCCYLFLLAFFPAYEPIGLVRHHWMKKKRQKQHCEEEEEEEKRLRVQRGKKIVTITDSYYCYYDDVV